MKNNTRKTLKIYWQETKGHRPLAFILILAVICGSATGTIIPLYFKKFFDSLTSAGSNKEEIVPVLISVIVSIAFLELLRWIFWRVATLSNNYFQNILISKLSNKCFAYLHKHSFAFFNNNFVGSLVKRVNWFSRAFESLADKITWNFLPLLTNITIVIIVLSTKNIWLSLGVIAWLVVFLIINWIFTSYELKYIIQRSELETKANGVLADTITNNSNVKLFNGYNRELQNYAQAVDKVKKLRIFTWNLDSLFEGVQGLLAAGLELGIFYIAVKLWQQNLLTVGDFVLLQSYVLILFEQFWNFGKIIRHMYSDLADAEEMTVILNTPHQIQDVHNAQKLKVNTGEIKFEDIDFYYHETRKIFSNLNFHIKANEKVAFVGPSGAGKTTVVKLLLRMHDVTSGKILIDDQRISHVTQESLWSKISMVPQDPILFHRSLLENIRYGRPSSTDEEVIEASKLAHCHEFISEFPEKYQTFVGERGVKLSGGERQRVAIARAILCNAPILVLDEATSSLDSESEMLIQDALNNLMKNKTVVVIAHRLSTIMKMDRILVISHGKIIEDGSHQELLKKQEGVYRQLWKLQAGGFIYEQPVASPEDEMSKNFDKK